LDLISEASLDCKRTSF